MISQGLWTQQDTIAKNKIKIMKKHLLITVFFLFCLTISTCYSQSLIESGELYQKLNGIINAMPGSGGNNYVEPNITEMSTWEQMLESLWEKDFTTATSLASQLNYDLIEFTDDTYGEVYYVLQTKAINGNYWGTYVFNPYSCQTNLVIQSPHPKYDSNTGKQGASVFENVGAAFFMLAGTHRCNSPTFTSCSGTTSSCGNSEAYRISDMAHNVNSIFQITHQFLYDKIPDVYTIQLHGFSWNSSLPHIIMSNGTSMQPIGEDKLSELGMALSNIDTSLLHGLEHITPSLPLSGSTNTQGRYTNGSANPCTVSAAFNSGRFFHLEQEYSKLRASSDQWIKMSMALNQVFRNVDIDETSLETGCYSAKDTLTSSTTIANPEIVNMEAGSCIKLQAGFETMQGADVMIQIDSCGL